MTDLSATEDPFWERFEIRVVPLVIVFKSGEPIFRKDGVSGRGLSRADLAEIVNAFASEGASA